MKFFAFVLAAFLLVACSDDGSDFAVRPSGKSSSANECHSGACHSGAEGDRICGDISSSSGAPQPNVAKVCKTETEDNCEYGELTDARDGQVYKTVKIGRLWWMAENLNYEVEGSYCYNDSAEYCAKYGRLYIWSAVVDSVGRWSETTKGCGNGLTCDPPPPVQGICPEGWFLPSVTRKICRSFPFFFTFVTNNINGVIHEEFL